MVLLILILIHTWSAYVQILDPSATLHVELGETPPAQVLTSSANFDRQELDREYTLTGWFQIETFIFTAPNDMIGILSGTQWLPCITGWDPEFILITYDTQLYHFSYSLQEVHWYFMAVWVDVNTSQFGICIGTWGGSETDWGSETYTSGSMRTFDRTTFTIDYGLLIQDHVQPIGQLFDVRLYNEVLTDTSSISTPTCHSFWNDSCWGPGNMSCNDYIQLTQPYEHRQIEGLLRWDHDDNYLQKRDAYYGANNSFTGWIQEDRQESHGVVIYTTNINKCPPDYQNSCHSRYVFYDPECSDTSAQDESSNWEYTENALSIRYNDDLTFDNNGELLGDIPNNSRTEWNFIAASFSEQDLLLVCFGIPGENLTWMEQDISNLEPWQVIWPLEPNDENIINRIRIGGSDYALNALVTDVRYYLNKAHTEQEFRDMATTQATSLRHPGYKDCWDCAECSDGYYLGDGQCTMWHGAWAACDGPSDLDCTSCSDGYKYMPTEGWWNTYCPAGSLEVPGSCFETFTKIMEYNFESFDQIFYDNISGVPGVLGISDLAESSDPAIIKNRGVYFDGVDDQLTLEYNHTGFYLPPNFSLFVWAKALVGQDERGLVLSRHGPNNNGLFGLVLGKNETGQFQRLFLQLENQVYEDYGTETTEETGIWKHVGLIGVFNRDDPYQYLSYMVQGQTQGRVQSASKTILQDLENNQFLIGTAFDADGTNQIFMKGSIYDFVLYNYEVTDIGTILHEETNLLTPWEGDCTFCPRETLQWISSCNYNWFIKPSGCQTWLSSWERGCTNPSDCNLCEDDYCVVCNYFGLNQCTEWEAGYSLSSEGTWSWAFGPTPCVVCQDGFTLLVDGTWSWEQFLHLGSWVDTCPNEWTHDSAQKICVQCPDNCATWPSEASCDTCITPWVLREDGLCHESCPSGQFATENGDCSDCFDTWETCLEATSDDCVLCPAGLARLDESAEFSSWYCKDVSIATKDVKFACIDSQIEENIAAEQILNAIEALVDSEELTEAEFRRVASQVSSLNLHTIYLEEQALSIVNKAGLNTMTNSGTSELSASTDKIDVILKLSKQQWLQGATVQTNAGSGVSIPIDLVEENYASADAELLVNVIQLKQDESDRELQEADVVSVEIYELIQDTDSTGAKDIHFKDMNNNFTLIWSGQEFNTTEDYEWVYLESGKWETSGCTLTYLDETSAECKCNHLSDFWVKKGKKEASTETNAETTTDFAAAQDYDLTSNITPNIVVASILTIYFVVFFFLYRAEKRSRRVGLSRRSIADEIHDFALRFQQSLANESINSESESQQSPSSSVQSSVISDVWEKSVDSSKVLDQHFDSVKSFHTPENSPYLQESQFSIRPQTAAAPIEFGHLVDKMQPVRSMSNEIPIVMVQSIESFDKNNPPADETTISEITFRDQQEEEQESDLSFKKETTIQYNTQMTAAGVPLEEMSPEKMKQKSIKRQFLKFHPLIGIFSSVDKSILRTERWTIFLAVVMISIYVTGLFYNADYDEQEEEKQSEQTIGETFTSFSWKDFWVIAYTMMITIPQPFILRWFFRRRKPDPTKNVMKQLRCMKIKRIIGYILVTCIVLWSLWCCIAFSLAFGYNTTQQWMLSFSFAEVFDFTFKDNMVTLIIAGVFVCISRLKARRRKKTQMTAIFPEADSKIN